MEGKPAAGATPEEAAAKTQRSIKRMRIAIWILAGIALVLGIYIYVSQLPPPFGKYDAFAKCISHTSTTFYGAWWCPHCHEQKNEFGDAAQYLPYVECANPDESETQQCKDDGVVEYPTWVYPDGSTSTGVASLELLSEKTSCALPTSTSS
ncbi:MAG TPA: hypothetical protein VHZ04_00640 [Candidatus Paceibacterota bacterium]|jgi:hypothetical protein|nr:hypothetical protein [Candidatus Paceibacterota bacterium]